MSVVKEPAIKLFGKTIQLRSNDVSDAATSLHDTKKHSSGGFDVTKKNDASTQHIILLEDHFISSATTSSGISKNPKMPAVENVTPLPNKKGFSNPTVTSTAKSDEKTLKKPDKILPCPRCNSMDTKFCYYNNYNVHQPRHFCKNCQRYWTAGGTMRNLPVGSGRRRNKSSQSSHYRHVMVSDNGPHLPTNSSSVPAFGSGSDKPDNPDKPLCESMASALNLPDKSINNVPNKFSIQECNNENWEDHSSGNSLNSLAPALMYPQISCFPAPHWTTSWSSGPWTNQMPPPDFCPWTYPVSFYPVPQYWGYTIPNPNSQTLGKHYRDEDKYSDSGVLIPKTLRINDPNDAAKSSKWSTLGFNNENSESTNGSNLFKAFNAKDSNEKNHLDEVENSSVLQANPAALSRSINFQETR